MSESPHQQAVDSAAGYVSTFRDVFLDPLIFLLMAIAFLVFVWGGFQYIINADNEQARSQGKKSMLFGIIGLLVMVSALAIMELFANTFGLGGVLKDPTNIEISDFNDGDSNQ